MGLFTRKSSPVAPVDEQIIIRDGDLSVCSAALHKFEEDILRGSGDDGIRACAREISRAAGIPADPDERMKWLLHIAMQNQKASPAAQASPLDKPWWWLVSVAEEATGQGDATLAGRIGFFLKTWRDAISPKMGLADEAECGGIKTIPADAYLKGVGIAVLALSSLPADETIVATSTQFIPAERLLPTLAGELLKFEQHGSHISPAAREAALNAVT